MKVIGIMGRSGSGKTTFASLLSKKLNCQHIDVDKIGHQALFQPEILDDLCDKFGTGILDENGNIDRKKVGTIVFAETSKMDILTDLTWNYMKKILNNILSQDDEVIVLDWMLLPKTDYWNKCDLKILVTSNDIQRKNKVLERDKISEEYFDTRDSASIDYSKFEFDYVFQNDYKLQTINEVIEKVNEQYFKQ